MNSGISYTPALPDGVDCPWTRRRRTRWWLVIPADGAGAVLVALFCAAATKTLGDLLTPIWQALGAVSLGWMVAWSVRRNRPDHLEMAAPDGMLVIATAWIAWAALRLVFGAGAGAALGLSWALMSGCFLVAFLGGWRWLYGYARAHDSLVPAPLARRMAAQDGAGSEGDATQAGDAVAQG